MKTFLPPSLAKNWHVLACLTVLILCETFSRLCSISARQYFGMTTLSPSTSKTSESQSPNQPTPQNPVDLTTLGANGDMPSKGHPIYGTPTDGASKISPLTNMPMSLASGEIISELFDLGERVRRLEEGQ